jgi:hypothetical protein
LESCPDTSGESVPVNVPVVLAREPNDDSPNVCWLSYPPPVWGEANPRIGKKTKSKQRKADAEGTRRIKVQACLTDGHV